MTTWRSTTSALHANRSDSSRSTAIRSPKCARELRTPLGGEGRGLVQRAPVAQWREARVEVVEALVGQLEPHQFRAQRLLQVVERPELRAVAVAGEDAVPGGQYVALALPVVREVDRLDGVALPAGTSG